MINYMLFFMSWMILMSVILIFRYVRKEIEHAKEVREIYNKWFFDSLYSINPNIKMPQALDRDVYEPAIIMKDDPMNEFKGEKDDWFK
jgi:hypothetical protein